ncbi:MAG: solute carrier family 23 protein [Ornithinimicrobium sp.]|uniref:uracil-xanthine permease family protein n=1 Tax=Ornithinimicrobium sp. TaxID=1977084 RepID=UPI0026E08CA3|nr:solute carrier family 23 protein [Ornithinimicrobium sp.]MDO5740945.1 solute carrier family 23 protein [Ornithinimicrobium sp.]
MWSLHGDGYRIQPGQVVAPGERLAWPPTIGIGMQHVVAMFGATFLVPLITGFPPSTTLLFSGLGTMIFLLVTRNRIPSYLGSSFAFLAPIAAAQGMHGPAGALGGVVMAGVTLALVGALVQAIGHAWISALMPPMVTGAIVALIGLNLAPTAWDSVEKAPVTALATIVGIVLCTVLFRGLLGRLSILVGVLVGYAVAAFRGEVDFAAIGAADWVGAPALMAPQFHWNVVGLFLPVVLVLVAENIGHVKSVAQMTELSADALDPLIGRTLLSDGLATTLAGLGGGSGTTTYAENIGVMAATKVYSTAAYWVAGLTAVVLAFLPKFGAAIQTVPVGVLGGAATVLYGMIGVLGFRIWVEHRVDFSNPINLTTGAVSLVIGIANYKATVGDFTFEGIALGTAAALVLYHGMNAINSLTGAVSGEDHLQMGGSTNPAPEISDPSWADPVDR